MQEKTTDLFIRIRPKIANPYNMNLEVDYLMSMNVVSSETWEVFSTVCS